MPTTTRAVISAPSVPRPVPSPFRPWVRIARTSTAVAMISVMTFCTPLRISGPVEKIPSTGPAFGAAVRSTMPSSVDLVPTISGSVRWAWNWP